MIRAMERDDSKDAEILLDRLAEIGWIERYVRAPSGIQITWTPKGLDRLGTLKKILSEVRSDTTFTAEEMKCLGLILCPPADFKD